MEDGIWHVQSWYWCDSWLLTSQGSFCSLPIFSLTEWWVGLSHILQWVKSSKSVHKDSSSAQLLWSTYPLVLPEVELENGDMAVQHQLPLGASWTWTREPRAAPLNIAARLLLLQWWLLCSALCGRTQIPSLITDAKSWLWRNAVHFAARWKRITPKREANLI